MIVIVINVPYNEGENAQERSERIIHEGLGMPEVPVVRAKRLSQRAERQGQQQTGTPLITIELPDLETKIRVLTSKRRLADPEQWSRSWMRSSKKSHTERLIDLNFQTVLDMIPDGNTMPITGSGRIVIKPS